MQYYWDAAKSERGATYKSLKGSKSLFLVVVVIIIFSFSFSFYCLVLSFFSFFGRLVSSGPASRFGFQSNGRTTRWNQPNDGEKRRKKK
jgi:uncharacterized membrane protein (DUF485 family)